MKPTRLNFKLTKLQVKDKVEALSDKLGGFYRTSRNGVPHFLIDVDGVRHSVCYFARHNNWALFFPYRTQTQTRVTLEDEEAVTNFLGGGVITTPPPGTR